MANLLNLNGGRLDVSSDLVLADGESWIIPITTPESVPDGANQRILARGSSDYISITTAMKVRWDSGENIVSDSTETLDVDTNYTFTFSRSGLNLALVVTRDSDSATIMTLNSTFATTSFRCQNMGGRSTGAEPFLGKFRGTFVFGTQASYSMDQTVGTTTVPDLIGSLDATLVGIASFEPAGGAVLPDIEFNGFYDNAAVALTDVNTDSSTFTVSGVINNGATVSEIEYKRGDGSWQSLIVSPANTWVSQEITITGADSLSFRSTNDISTEYVYSNVHTSFIVLPYGQSNPSGRVTPNQVPTLNGKFASSLNGQDLPVALTDPYNTPADSGAIGSYIPAIATLLASDSLNSAFIPCAVGGASINVLGKGSQNYTNMTRRVNSLINGVNLAFFHQGEADKGDSLSTRTTQVNQLVNDMFADFGVDTYLVDIGDDDADALVLEQANADVISSNDHAFYGGTASNAMPVNQLHISTATEANAMAAEIYQYIDPFLVPVISTLNMTATGAPDGVYEVDYYNDDTKTLITTENVTFTNGNATKVFSLPVGTNILMFEPGNNPPETGLAYYGVTV